MPAGMGYWSGALVALMPKFSLFWLTVSRGIDPVPECPYIRTGIPRVVWSTNVILFLYYYLVIIQVIDKGISF